MTCIAFDGRSLAADRQMTCGTEKYTLHKIRSLRGNRFLACAGDATDLDKLARWINGGMKESTKPTVGDTDGLLIEADGSCVMLTGTDVIRDIIAPVAIGSGSQVALAAMRFGLSAEQAVKMASTVDPYTGDQVDVVAITPRPTKRRVRATQRTR